MDAGKINREHPLSALSGFRIIELAEGPAGEYCGKLLSDFGANVIKIERPGTGSPTRAMGPLGAGDEADLLERSGLFAWLNTNKSSVTLDLATEAGRETLGRLLEHADAVIDDHAGGWLDGLGLGLGRAAMDEAHPKLVVCSITPFGPDPSPDRLHAEDLIVMQKSGWGYHTPSGADPAKPPLKGPGRFLASYEGALEGAMCVAAALYHAGATGEGQFIDVSRYEVMVSRVDYVLAPMVAGDADVSTSRTAFDLSGPSGIFRCGAGFVYIWMSAPSHWEGLKTLMGTPRWMEEFPENWLERAVTPERVAMVRERLTTFLADKEKHSFAADAQKVGMTVASVNDARDLQASPQYQHRRFFTEVEHPVLGRVAYPGVPYQMSLTPAAIERPAPLLGQHSDDVIAGLAASAEN